MADNIAVTAGTGTSIATDDISSVHYQRVKLSLGADGTAVDAVAGAGAVGTGVQRVTLASDDPAVTDLAAIEVLLGTIDADTGNIATSVGVMDDWDNSDAARVSTPSSMVQVTLSLDTSAYADGDVLADTQAITNAMRYNDGLGTLASLTVLDEDDQGVAMDLVFFNANVSLGTENSAPSITDANARNILGRVRVNASDYIDLGGSRIATLTGIGLKMQPATGTRDVYVAAITRGGTPTHTASGIRVFFGFDCD